MIPRPRDHLYEPWQFQGVNLPLTLREGYTKFAFI
jgi:hypothetical protein